MDTKHGRGYVYSIQYHIVWCVKYRHKILTQKIENRLIEIINMVAECENFQILECNTDKDHIHLLVDCSPQHYIPNVVQKKLWGGNLWNPSYFVVTVSENTEEQIRKYIKNQKRK